MSLSIDKEPRDGVSADATAAQRELAPSSAAQLSITAGVLPLGAVLGIVAGAVGVGLLLWLVLDASPGLAVVVTAAGYLLTVGLVSRAVEGPRKATDRVVTGLVTSAFLLAMLPLVSVLFTVVRNGLTRFDATFFTWDMRGVIGEGGGIYHAVTGTLLITLGAAVMSIPVGMLTAIYLVEYGQGGRLARSITFFVDVMTGIPSIVAGLFAFAFLAIFFGGGVRMGFGGSLALSVLMIPVVVRSVEEMLKLVPNELREASYALGVPKYLTVLKVVLPTALAGIATGITLAIARVIGETAPLLIIAGSTTSTNFDLFDGRMASLPVFSYLSYSVPGVPREPFLDRAWAAALVLILIVMLLNVVARVISAVFSPKGGR